MLGGGMRQAGIIAAAGIHALTHHVTRLALDHARAAQLTAELGSLAPFAGRLRCATNMVFVELEPRELARLTTHLAVQHIKIRGPRWVLHLDIDDADLQRVVDAARRFQPAGA